MTGEHDPKQPTDPRKPTEKPVPPQHPGNDPAMPPYTPGGVPEPSMEDQEEAAAEEEREVPPSVYPPKRAP
jgi:hypothetical protein